MMALSRPPYLGAAYYPEDWPEAEIDRDIEKMREIGVNCVRIAEFAWYNMEPKPGEFDFSFFHRVIDKLGSAGISVMLCTPTATPPIWLPKRYPDIFALGEDGRRRQHGGRRHACSNNPHYNEYCMRIVEKMAREFAGDPFVVGWQIDNEIYTGNSGCFCPNCVGAFRESLRKQYGDIDRLNEAWNHHVFSQWYESFEDIPAPQNAWHNPHLLMAWQIFQNDSHIAFVHRQAEILHKYVRVPVGTDTMPVNGMNYRRMNEKLDIVEFNHYNTPENLHYSCFWFDFLRTLKPRPFWNTETATCWNGSTSIRQSVKPEGFCRANSWLPIALGGEANLYWLWRTHWAGHELMHGAVLDTSFRPMHTTGEVEQVARGYEAARDFIQNTRVSADIAIHFTSLNWNMFMQQSLIPGLQYAPAVIDRFYKPLVDLGLRPDVIDAEEPLDPYKVIFSPLMLTLEEANLPARIEAWVKNGGTWIAGPMTDQRNACGARYTDCLYGMLEKLTGIEWKYALPDAEGRIRAQWADGENFDAALLFELSDPGRAEALASVTEGHSALLGKAVLLRARVGKGQVILLGALPAPETVKKLARALLPQAGIPVDRAKGEIMVSPREGARKGEIVVEYGGKGGAYFAPAPARDLLTDRVLSGEIPLAPYDVLVLEREG